ncbi:hypothetical protein LXL04_011692 [Taraxacum kok-saghyz]
MMKNGRRETKKWISWVGHRDEQKLQVPELRTGTATELAVPELELPQASPVPIPNIRELPSAIPVLIPNNSGTATCRTVRVDFALHTSQITADFALHPNLKSQIELLLNLQIGIDEGFYSTTRASIQTHHRPSHADPLAFAIRDSIQTHHHLLVQTFTAVSFLILQSSCPQAVPVPVSKTKEPAVPVQVPVPEKRGKYLPMLIPSGTDYNPLYSSPTSSPAVMGSIPRSDSDRPADTGDASIPVLETPVEPRANREEVEESPSENVAREEVLIVNNDDFIPDPPVNPRGGFEADKSSPLVQNLGSNGSVRLDGPSSGDKGPVFVGSSINSGPLFGVEDETHSEGDNDEIEDQGVLPNPTENEIEDILFLGSQIGFQMEGFQSEVAVAVAELGFKKRWTRELVKDFKRKILCIQESKTDQFNCWDAKALGGKLLNCWAHTPASGNSGGIVTLWDPKFFTVQATIEDRNFLLVTGLMKDGNVKLSVINVYAPQEDSNRRQFGGKLPTALRGTMKVFGWCVVTSTKSDVQKK